MSSKPIRYVLDLARANGGGSLGQFTMNVDLEPVTEWGRFSALRRWLDPALAAEAEIRVQPIWHAQAGAPYVAGLRVTARADAVPPVKADIPARYFKSAATRMAASLVSQKKLGADESFTYAVLAFPASRVREPASGDRLDIEEVPVPATLNPGSISDAIEQSVAFGDPGAGLIPVFVPQGIIDEAIELTERADKVEAGALLIGKMHLDAGSRELFLKVTAQIPARHTSSDSTRLSFTAETFAAVQAAVDLRRSREQLVGWTHNHPATHWCKETCPPEARQKCPLGEPFFSSMDCDLHRICFLNPGCVALLVTNAFSGMKVTMYGWDRAIIVQRGFYIIKSDAGRPLPAGPTASIIGADPHETPCHP